MYACLKPLEISLYMNISQDKIISNTDKNYRKENQQIPFNHFGNTGLNSYNKS